MIQIHTHDAEKACGPMPLARTFEAHLDGCIAKGTTRAKRSLQVFDLTVGRIIKRREATKPADADRTYWTYSDWFGLACFVHLGKREGFDSEFIYNAYERIKARATREAFTSGTKYPMLSPELSDYAEMARRTWTFHAGDAVCTLAAFAHRESEVCRKVMVGTEPKYELVCEGSPLR